MVNSHWLTFRMPLFPGWSGKASLSLIVDLKLFLFLFSFGWGSYLRLSQVRRIILVLRAVSASRAVGSPRPHVWKHIAYSCSPGLAISRKNFCCFSWAWYPGLSFQFPGRWKQEDHMSMACQGYIASSRPGWAVY